MVKAQASGRFHLRMHGVGTVGDGLPKQIGVIAAETGQVGIGHDRGGIVAHHAVAVAGTGPFGQETALAIHVGEPFLNLCAHLGIDQVEQGEEGAEHVPHAEVGVEPALLHRALEGAVMDQVALCVFFKETAWEEQGAVQAGIERAGVVQMVVVHFDAAQPAVPLVGSGLHHVVEGARAQFAAEVDLGLFGADERRTDAHGDCSARLAESHDGKGVVALDGGFVFFQSGAVGRGQIGKRPVELHDEVVAEVLGHPARVARGVAHYFPFFRNDFDV